MVGNRLSLTWLAPVAISVTTDRLHHDDLALHDQAGTLVHCLIGRNVSLHLQTAGGTSWTIDGAVSPNVVVEDVIALDRLPGERPSTVDLEADADLTVVASRASGRSEAAAARARATTEPLDITAPRRSLAAQATPIAPAPDLDATIAKATPTIPMPPGLLPAPAGSAATALATAPPVAARPAARPILVRDIAGEAKHTVADTLYIGRAPVMPPDAPTGRTAALMVISPSDIVSSTHLRLRLSHDQLLVLDTRSTNGTRIVPPAGRPYRLGPNEELPVAAGTRLELGDGVVIFVPEVK